MTATRQRKGLASCQPDSLQIPRSEAVAAKRSMQSALELVRRAGDSMLPGQQKDTLDHASRMIVVGITALRDADSDSNGGMRKTERSDPSAVSNRKSSIGDRK